MEIQQVKQQEFTKCELDEILQTICKMYTINNDALQLQNNQNARTLQRKRSPRYPTRLECGKRLFSKQPVNRVVPLFIAALKHVPKFKEEFAITDRHCEFIFRNGANIEHILIQSFFLWMENCEACWRKQKALDKCQTSGPVRMNSPDNSKTDDFRPSYRTPSPPRLHGHRTLNSKTSEMQANDHVKGSGEKITISESELDAKNNDSTGTELVNATEILYKTTLQQRILVSPKQCDEFLDLLIPIEFTSKGPYIWKTIISLLELKSHKYVGNFICRIRESIKNGQISFSILQYCLSQSNLSQRMAIPDMAFIALLLGPLDANTIEQFVSNRPNEFRLEVKRFLLKAEALKASKSEFEKSVIEFVHKKPEEVPSFEQFCVNVTRLLSDLRNEVIEKENLVNNEWAHSLIKNAARKFYQEKTWHKDQFNDLVHTLLVQRPTLKSYLLNVVLKDHKDRQAFERWRNFISADRIHMSKNFEKVDLHLDDSIFLSLPRRCEVFVIGNIQQFRIFEKQFNEYEHKRTAKFFIGIDAEWNSYVMKSRASLLQLSLSHSVYLLDLDALYLHEDFLIFIDRFFMNSKIIKIGYQFDDDLIQLRIRLPHCIGLYRPNSLYCIGRIVDELYRRSKHIANFPLDQYILPITGQDEEAMKEHTRQVKPHYPGRGNNRANKTDVIPTTFVQNEELNKFAEVLITPIAGLNNNNQTRIIKFAEQGLSYICKRILGKPLNKQEQCSVWDRRPLRSSQIRYAALDAHCIIQIHNRCCEWIAQLKLGGTPHELVHSNYKYTSLPLFWDKPLPPELQLFDYPIDVNGQGAFCDAQPDEFELSDSGW